MRYRKSITGAALALATVVTALGAAGAGAQTRGGSGADPANATSQPRTITVNGSGQVRGTPDVMELTIGVDTRARTAAQALHRNSELAGNVLGVLRSAGVNSSDLQTSALSVSPVYNDNGKAVFAYAVTNTVDARIKDLGTAGDVVDAATKVAGDEIVVNGLYFSFDDSTKLVAQARTDAVKRARAQAEQLAAAAGVQLGDLQSMTEASTPNGPPVNAAAPKSAGDATPVNPGSQTLSVDVTLVYEIR